MIRLSNVIGEGIRVMVLQASINNGNLLPLRRYFATLEVY